MATMIGFIVLTILYFTFWNYVGKLIDRFYQRRYRKFIERANRQEWEAENGNQQEEVATVSLPDQQRINRRLSGL